MIRSKLSSLSILFTLGALLAAGCGGDDATGQGLDVQWDEASQRLHILVNRGLNDGETLHARVRTGEIGTLNCVGDYAGIDRVDGAPLPATTGSPSARPST